MTWKSTAVFSGAGLLATWLASYPPANAPDPAAPAAAPLADAGADITEQADRLQEKVRGVIEYQDPARNPFRFERRSGPANGEPDRAGVAREPALEFVAPAPPPITLTGIATDIVDGIAQRTVMLSTASGLVFAKEGDAVAGYRVASISAESVELVAPDGTSLTIR
jgi:hypothetical protein